jgi:hypothetical protein
MNPKNATPPRKLVSSIEELVAIASSQTRPSLIMAVKSAQESQKKRQEFGSGGSRPPYQQHGFMERVAIRMATVGSAKLKTKNRRGLMCYQVNTTLSLPTISL